MQNFIADSMVLKSKTNSDSTNAKFRLGKVDCVIIISKELTKVTD